MLGRPASVSPGRPPLEPTALEVEVGVLESHGLQDPTPGPSGEILGYRGESPQAPGIAPSLQVSPLA